MIYPIKSKPEKEFILMATTDKKPTKAKSTRPQEKDPRGGPGRNQGNKQRLINPKIYKIRLGEDTVAALKAINPNMTKAIRILTNTDQPLRKAEGLTED
jgi:hypothetical protein